MFDPRWYTVAGQSADLIGAVVLLSGTVVPKRQAIEIGVMRLSGDTDEEDLRLPQVQDRLRQSRRAVWGLLLLAAGFALQVIGTWPR